MRIRTKIAVWTGSFALVVAICFSSFVFLEMIEQPFLLIDQELRDLGETITETLLINKDGQSSLQLELSQHHYNRYWIKIEEDYGEALFSTPITKQVEIPRRTDKVFYFVTADIALSQLSIAQEDLEELEGLTEDRVVFRVMAGNKVINGRGYRILLARPIPVLIHEIKELCVELAVGTILCLVAAVFASYYLAGKILQPFSTINSLIREISESSLEKRIPVGKGRDELSTLAGSLNGMFDRLQHSFNRQKEFVGNAAHELKSPLTILLLSHEELLSGDIPETIQMGLLRQQKILRRLSRLVRNLLEISRLEQRVSAKVETFDLTAQIFHVLDEFKEVLQMKNIVVDTRLEVKDLGGDTEKILRMLINLVDNAIKYNSSNHGCIWITTQKMQDIVRIIISNTGQIIPEEALPQIFDQFFRVEQSRSTAFGGSGLGLTIVKHIVELHYGTISVTSSSDGITRFSIDLPQFDMTSVISR